MIIVVSGLNFKGNLDRTLKLLIEFYIKNVSYLCMDHVSVKFLLKLSVLRVLVDVYRPYNKNGLLLEKK